MRLGLALILLTFFASHGFAQAEIELGECKPWENTKIKTEEDFAREEAEKAHLTKEELLARLIYSESLSTSYWNGKCSAKSAEDIMTSIGWGVLNRLKVKAAVASVSAYSEVIFRKNQFRTSFSGKKKNPFAEAFLCPLKSQNYLNTLAKKATAAELFKKSQAIASDLIAEYERNGLHTKYKNITNFFYPKSEFFGEKRPAWAPHANPTKNKGYLNLLDVSGSPCIEFYHLK